MTDSWNKHTVLLFRKLRRHLVPSADELEVGDLIEEAIQAALEETVEERDTGWRECVEEDVAKARRETAQRAVEIVENMCGTQTSDVLRRELLGEGT